MSKLVAIIRHEYWRRVRSVGFIIATVLGPLLVAATFIVPVLIAFIQPGTPTLAVLDESGKVYETLRAAVDEHKRVARASDNRNGPALPQVNLPAEIPTQTSGELADFNLEKVPTAGRSFEEARHELQSRVLGGRLDAFVVIPQDVLAGGTVEYYGRSSGDPISNEQFDNYLNKAIVELRLAQAGVPSDRWRELSAQVNIDRVRLSERGGEKVAATAFFQITGIGLLLFVTLMSYGGSILNAVMV